MSATDHPGKPGTGVPWGKLAVAAAGVVVLAGLALAWRYTPLAEFLTREQLYGWARWMREYPWAPLLLVLAYTPASFILFPRPALTMIAAVAFGPWLGFTLAMSGMMLAALIAFWLGRAVPYERIRRLAGKRLDRIRPVVRRHGVLAVFAVRFIPSAPFALEGMAVGAMGVRAWHYAVGTFLGISPGIFAEAVLGGQLAEALAEDGEISWWIVAAALGLLVAFVLLGRRWAKRYME
jgi:phospholipase D1/2